jgi:hypothetical protein
MPKQMHHDLNDTGEITQRTARICIVDLASSQPAKAAGAIGPVPAEGPNIYKPLTMLGRVIAAVGSNHSHHPSRNYVSLPSADRSSLRQKGAPPFSAPRCGGGRGGGEIVPYGGRILT